MFSKHQTYSEHNTKEGGDSGYSYNEFIDFMKDYPQFIDVEQTYFKQYDYYINVLKWDDKKINKMTNIGPKDTYATYILGYDDFVARRNPKLHERCYSGISYFKWISASIHGKENYQELKLFFDMAKKLNLNLLTYDSIITESYLEALRIKEENRGIKLTKDQSHVLDSTEDQCRWFYIPTDDVYKVLNIFGIQPNIKDGDITSIIDDVQREKTIAIATFTGHTIIFGCNVPYIAYPDMQTYLAKDDHHTTHLQEVLNKLSKAFGIAAYFEYNNDDELIASLAWSSKGKFVYGRFTSEGEGQDIFGTQKKTMDVNQKSIIKTAKKLGMTPEDILTGIMKQKINVQYFEQLNWYIESRLKNLK